MEEDPAGGEYGGGGELGGAGARRQGRLRSTPHTTCSIHRLHTCPPLQASSHDQCLHVSRKMSALPTQHATDVCTAYTTRDRCLHCIHNTTRVCTSVDVDTACFKVEQRMLHLFGE